MPTYQTTIELPSTIVDFVTALASFTTIDDIDVLDGTVDVTFTAADEWELHEAVLDAINEVLTVSGYYIDIPRPEVVAEGSV